MFTLKKGKNPKYYYQFGMSSIEILIALTILIVLMVGINGILVTKSKLNSYQKDIQESSNIVQTTISQITNKASSDINYYLSLQGKIEANLSSYPFQLENNKFVGVLTVKSGEAKTTKSTNFGNNVTIFIDKSPSQINLVEKSMATIYNIDSGFSENIFVDKTNDASKHFLIDSTAPHKGRKGLMYSYPEGSIVIAGDKIIKIELFYADKDNKEVRSIENPKSLASMSIILPFPFGIR